MRKKEVVPQMFKNFVNRREFRDFSQICVECGSCHNKLISICLEPWCRGRMTPLAARAIYNNYKNGKCKYIDKFGRKISKRRTCLDRVKIKITMLNIQNSVSRFLSEVLFEPWDSITKNSVLTYCNTILENLKSRRELLDFKVDWVTANKLIITVQPQNSLEYVVLTFITKTGVPICQCT